jgi:Xaa-Pro aminopeptidase
MLTAEGCRQRRERLWERLDPPPEGDHLRLTDPIHLTYLANFNVDPFSSAAGFGGCLLVRRDGHAKLLHDNQMPDSVRAAHVEETVVVPWYDSQSPARGPRQLALLGATNPSGAGLRFHDRIGDPYAPVLVGTLAEMRRQKDPYEVEALRRSMWAGEAGHAEARRIVRPGLTEFDVYLAVSAACEREAGRAVILYGDFAVSPGPERTVGGQPRADQRRLYDLCVAAMSAGEAELRAGQACRTVYDAVRGVFDRAGVAQYFPHHAGHGIGLAHPEAPYLVRHATETLLAGDVVTLEPGLYVPGVGGIRIENNYLITESGYERLTHHAITLV